MFDKLSKLGHGVHVAYDIGDDSNNQGAVSV